MANFVVIPLSKDTTQLSKIISDKYGNDAYSLENGDTLVSYTGTSKQLSDELGITDGVNGNALVLNFSGYWGRAVPDVWEWINEHSK